MAKPKVMIATPERGDVKTAYMKSVLSTTFYLAGQGIECSFETEPGGDPALQRNFLAQTFLNDPAATHLFGVDSDMAFSSDLCSRLMAYDVPVVGAVCSRRNFDHTMMSAAIKRGHTPDDAYLFGVDWIVMLGDASGKVKVENYLMEVEAIGFGAIVIQRHVFETMIANGCATKQFNHSRGDYNDFFRARPQDSMAGEGFSEDVSFCRRWRYDCGGKVMGFTDARIYHIGDYSYGGSFHRYLEVTQCEAKEKV